jgi:CheY-like chemotaxis protein
MKKILIVEDELIVRSIYRRKFEISGYQVETAEEGTAALNLLPTFKPDAIQVDIMLPGMDGVEVIRQIRSWPDFKTVPILVISSFYRPDLAKEAWKAGATKCVSKMDCTPNLALELVEQMLNGETAGAGSSAKTGMITMPKEAIRVIPAESPWESPTEIITRKPMAAAGAPPITAPPAPVTAPAPKPSLTLPTLDKEKSAMDITAKSTFAKPEPGGTKFTTRPTFASPQTQKLTKSAVVPDAPLPLPPSAPPPKPVDAPPPSAANEIGNTTFRVEIRQEFLNRAPQIQTDLRDRVGALLKSKSTADQIGLLRQLETSIASLASLAGITGFSRISHIAGAMDALIKELHKKPAQMTGSVLRTIAHAADCLNTLFHDLERTPRDIPHSMLILAVDDEPIARRTISVALAKANLRCIGMEDPQAALAVLRENPFDLIFLDAEMPGITGFQLCSELRKLPTNKATPVIFVTSLTKFEVRAQSSLAGGNDLIAKPFLMMELAVKALTYLLRPSPGGDLKTQLK